MPQENYRPKTEVGIAHLEQEEQTPEVQETIAQLRTSLQEEIEETVAEFKIEDNKVEEIEKSVNLGNPEGAEIIEKELHINEALQDLDKKADELKEEAGLEKTYDQTEKETFIEFNEIISKNLNKYNLSFAELVNMQNSENETKAQIYRDVTKELDHIDINKFTDSENLNIDNISLITENDLRKFLTEHIISKTNLSNEKLLSIVENNRDIFIPNNEQRLLNIEESFYVLNSPEKLPPQILETLQKFEDCYGNKGRDLVALAISTYGTQNPEIFKTKMESIEQVLNKYNHDTIPSGAKVSMGVEYEVTESIAENYKETSAFDYKKDIVLVSGSANIGKGKDAVHEIALKPNYNPYMLLAEMKLLQDGGFLDLNFEKYPNAARGYHLSIVGDSGLKVNGDMFFLNNVMTMAQLTGITAGKEISQTKHIVAKDFENFSNNEQKGDRCEIKGMSTDSIEQFEKAVITSHHAGIAIQLCNKYLKDVWEYQFGTFTSNADDFEKFLLEKNHLLTPFQSDQERDIVFSWLKLKNSVCEAININNEYFVDSEFNGYILKENGDYVDTSEHIDIVRNKKLIDVNTLSSKEFKDEIYIEKYDLFRNQQNMFVNTLTNINNIFLKPPKDGDNSPINATSVLNTMKKENYGEIMDGKAQESTFDNGGEFRDGYYYIQGASEEMIIHKSQILLNHFNRNMDKLLQTKGVPRVVEQEELMTA
ncbi:MAG: hypothetical protein KBB54_03280 [Candidatus Pacebacteria bacterium]|nr:hypothetical protein [Candidatus Paceibacterota bacterium]